MLELNIPNLVKEYIQTIRVAIAKPKDTNVTAFNSDFL